MATILGLKGVRAILARLLFAIHSLLAIGCLVERGCPMLVKPEENWIFWSFTAIPFLLFVEGAATVLLRNGDEYRWFCPCVFIFLCGSVPPIWFLEMTTTYQAGHKNETTVSGQDTTLISTTLTTTAPFIPEIMKNGTANYNQGLEPDEIYIFDVKEKIKAIIPLPPWWSELEERWVQLVEQTLLIVLIVGRWLLPKGQITRDQLSQLLLAYLAISADIVELFSIFVDVSEVRQGILRKLDMRLTIILLTIWSVSLIQFFMVLTTVKGQKARYCFKESTANHVIIDLVQADAELMVRSISNASSIGRSPAPVLRNKHLDAVSQGRSPKPPQRKITAASLAPPATCKDKVCSVSVWGILLTVILQDGPFLALRLYLIVLYGKASYTMFFFVCKNTLIILVQLYRLLVICIENPKNAGATGLLIDGFGTKEDSTMNGSANGFRGTASPKVSKIGGVKDL